ncbi:efflux RND transporter periplasmic adaptor subunit [Oceanisphaera avium]|uniref:efflux RND transporter periplasmic adaptor subunit n=1 Tax=Oceanisphaera avium TaxID=1903694 RepID=UPI001E5EB2D3|nr:efflux RND transporter periplasmic adaptor subunit [Oceanisphaera avium]
MKKYLRLWLAVGLVSALSGCGEPEPEAQAEAVIRPVPMMKVTASHGLSGLRFPGRVRAVQRAELAFNLPGRMIELPVKEGQRIEKGALVARLDDETVKLQLASAQAQYNKASTDYNRVNKIWQQSKAVAKAEVDQKRTAMEVARASFLAAKKDVADTRLLAPFAGVVTKRQVENFSNVQAKQTIVSLQDPNELEIVINVSERIVRAEPKSVAGVAVFADFPNTPLPVSLKSFSSQADAQTQSYEVVLALAPGFSLKVLPGMSVEVQPQADASDVQLAKIWVPLTAILSNAKDETQVWLFDEQSQRVSAHNITLGQVQDTEVQVLSGLSGGEHIVTAGVSQLREGMQVRPLAR